jgi:hypothetical protein
VQDVPLPCHPPEPNSYRNKPRKLTSERKRLSVLLPVVKQIALEVFQDRPCNFCGLRQAAIMTPGDKEPYVASPILYRVFRVVFHPKIREMLFHHRG